jgi:hypothetical protein
MYVLTPKVVRVISCFENILAKRFYVQPVIQARIYIVQIPINHFSVYTYIMPVEASAC